MLSSILSNKINTAIEFNISNFIKWWIKKLEERFLIWEKLLDENLLPLHGCFSKEGVAIIWASGSGKTYLANKLGLNIISNDFAIMQEDWKFFCLDILNYKKNKKTNNDFETTNQNFKNLNTDRVIEKINTIFLLTEDLDDERDLWRPTEEEIINIIKNSHPNYLNKSSYTLESSLIKTIFAKKNIIAINKKSTRNSNIINTILKKEYTNLSSSILKVNFIWLWRVTKDVISKIISSDQNYNIGIYSNNNARADVIIRDYRSCSSIVNNVNKKVELILNWEELLNTDLLVYATSTNKKTNIIMAENERMSKKESNEEFIKVLSDKIKKIGFSWNILMLTNPVEELCKTLYKESWNKDWSPNRLLSNQIIWIWPWLDVSRAKMILNDSWIKYWRVISKWQHCWLINIEVYDINNNFLDDISQEITKQVQNESKKLRDLLKKSWALEYEQRTIYWPSDEVITLIKNFWKSKESIFSAQQKDWIFSAVSKPFNIIS